MVKVCYRKWTKCASQCTTQLADVNWCVWCWVLFLVLVFLVISVIFLVCDFGGVQLLECAPVIGEPGGIAKSERHCHSASRISLLPIVEHSKHCQPQNCATVVETLSS